MEEDNLFDLEFIKEMEYFLNAHLSSILNGYNPKIEPDIETLDFDEVDK